MPDDTIPTPTIEKSEGLIMSQPQRETVTVSEFLQSAQEARAKHPPGTVFGYEKLRIMADNDSASNNPLDLRYLHFKNVDFRRLNAAGALCERAAAYQCDFTGSDWSGAKGKLGVYRSNVDEANFTGTIGFEFVDSYARGHFFPQGLTAEQAQSIIPVSYDTSILLDTCDDDHAKYILKEQKRILELEEKLAALAEQVKQLSQRQQ